MFHTRRLHGWGLAIAAILLPAGLSAQISTTISGVVRSETQSPVRGAFVQITSLNLSTVTNDGGYYRLVVPSTAGGTLTVSVTSIGFKPVERQIGLRPGNMQLDFTMAEQAVVLNEVVVTGTAGRQERRAQAAVVSTISAAKVVEAAPVQNVANLLQARTPGVVIRNNSGSTGTSSTIRIRGQASIELSNEPLVFINGIRMQSGDRQLMGVGNQSGGFLNDIKIEDIESIEIVKGPAAATLYGADANAGVINIITKRGRTQSGWTQTVSMEYGQSEPAFTPPDNVARCTAADQAPNRATVFPACQGIPVNSVLVDNPLIREQAFGDGRYRNLSWNVRGGGERFGAFLSMGADDDDGTLPNNHYGHLSGSAAFDYFVNEKLRIETDFRLGQTSTQLPRNDNDIYGYLGGGLLGDPRTRGAAKDGWYGNNRQTLAISAYENVDKTMRIQPRVSVSYTPWQWFTHRITAGGDLSRIKAYSFWAKNDIGWWDDAPRNTGRISEARRSIDRYTVDYLGTVTRQLASELRADVSFGSQIQTRKQDTVDTDGTGLINNEVRTVSSAAQLTGGGQTVTEDRQIGFFTQAQFAWKEKIYFVAGARVDQLSSFGADSEPFYSPKVGVSYVISDEPFFRNAISEAAVSALRLRAAYGVTGRSPTSGARTTYSPTTNQITATTVGIGVLPDDIGNPAIRAEKGKELELGFEAGLLRDRLGLELTYFHKKSLDAILEQPIPGSQGLGGTSGPLVNVGAILNKGFELAANARVLTMENVSLELRGAVNTLHNELLDLGGTPATTTRKEGFPLSGQWDYKIRKVDLATNTVTVSDTLEFIGNSPNLPEWESTASATLTLLRNISFYAQFDGRGGVVQYDNTAQFRDRQNGFTAANVIGPAAYGANPDGTPTDAAKEKWMRKFGCIAPCPHAGAWMTEVWTDSLGVQRGGRTLSRTTVRGDYIQDAGFIRLREVSVSYSLPRDIVSRYLRAQSLRLTVGMRNNLKTWTDFDGLDPESDQFLTVPADRRWTARLNFTF